jgi:hypothetical protein
MTSSPPNVPICPLIPLKNARFCEIKAQRKRRNSPHTYTKSTEKQKGAA